MNLLALLLIALLLPACSSPTRPKSALVAGSVATAKVPKPPNPWLCSVFQNCIPDDPGWQPEFATNPMVLSPFSGATQPANRWYFATKADADFACKWLGCAGVYEQIPCNIGGGPVKCSHPEYILKFPTGDKNAGYLVAYIERNPLNWFPGVALSLAKADMLK